MNAMLGSSSPMVEDDENETAPSAANSNMMISSPARETAAMIGPTSSSPSGAGGVKFVPDQRVFTKDNEFLYEAVVRKTKFDVSKQCWTYLVHFNGWNSRWDKWHTDETLLEDTPEVRLKAQQTQLQQEQQQQQIKAKREKRKADMMNRKRKNSGAGTASATSGTTSSSVSTSNKRRGTIETQEQIQTYFDEICELPFTLKTILIDDRDRFLRKGFDTLHNGYDAQIINAPVEGGGWRPARDVHQLPATVTVAIFLNHYVKFKRKEASSDEKAAVEEQTARHFADRFAALFDETLPKFLLYEPERPQHNAIEADSKLSKLKKCELYGCEHLLRFFLRLPTILTQATSASPGGIDATSRKEMGKQISELIVLLQKNRHSCFKAKYREPKYEELNNWEKKLYDSSREMKNNEKIDNGISNNNDVVDVVPMDEQEDGSSMRVKD
mmetsp:Transcript_11705/g.18142  ORF Transcript_11705/g.18142 Transcript_11705/m.18142 type:complete len:441 (+) Transcript_11705:235-1557(+)|eukprot:CAMPEP_0195294528 /NCGR_PEP_ID=MMETSP0707-20130614/15254_1 /TAXON_ID=33640 /ORGANISM="Asterionellopsis glacialis, Strain CCMP134" /LENGTH=440 /DNA_ID=CAMNT_0040355523 /DNA_START=120 /DNA_END=1442 /DNA_ORIENTATION=+